MNFANLGIFLFSKTFEYTKFIPIKINIPFGLKPAAYPNLGPSPHPKGALVSI